MVAEKKAVPQTIPQIQTREVPSTVHLMRNPSVAPPNTKYSPPNLLE